MEKIETNFYEDKCLLAQPIVEEITRNLKKNEVNKNIDTAILKSMIRIFELEKANGKDLLVNVIVTWKWQQCSWKICRHKTD